MFLVILNENFSSVSAAKWSLSRTASALRVAALYWGGIQRMRDQLWLEKGGLFQSPQNACVIRNCRNIYATNDMTCTSHPSQPVCPQSVTDNTKWFSYMSGASSTEWLFNCYSKGQPVRLACLWYIENLSHKLLALGLSKSASCTWSHVVGRGPSIA